MKFLYLCMLIHQVTVICSSEMTSSRSSTLLHNKLVDMFSNESDSLGKYRGALTPNEDFERPRRVLNSFRKNFNFNYKLKEIFDAAQLKEKRLEEMREIQQEVANQIYRNYLAKKTRSSILNDFITLRY